MMQIDGKVIEDLIVNMVLENNNLKDTNLSIQLIFVTRIN
jgi:hypothetical protein